MAGPVDYAYTPNADTVDRLAINKCIDAQFGPSKPAAPPTSGSPGTPATTSAPPTVEGPGSTSHGTDAQFCTSHQCIKNFSNGNGYIVQCQDGKWSHSGGSSGACSDHGGET